MAQCQFIWESRLPEFQFFLSKRYFDSEKRDYKVQKILGNTVEIEMCDAHHNIIKKKASTCNLFQI